MILAAVLALWQFLKQSLLQLVSLLSFKSQPGISFSSSVPKLALRRSNIPEVIWEQLYRRQHELLFAEVMHELLRPSNLKCQVHDCECFGTKKIALCTLHKSAWRPDEGIPTLGHPFLEATVLAVLGLNASTHFMPDERMRELKAQLRTFPLAAYSKKYRSQVGESWACKQMNTLFNIEHNLSVDQAVELWRVYKQKAPNHGGDGWYRNGDHFGYHFNMLLNEKTLAFWELPTDGEHFPWVGCFDVVRKKRELIDLVLPVELRQELVANYEQLELETSRPKAIITTNTQSVG
jgi:hypothetical protein